MKKFLIVIVILKIAQGTYGLSCVKCDSSYDESCHFLQPTTRATLCAGGLPGGTEDQCFIQFTEMGVTIRGCLSENPHMVEVCESGTGNCNTCFEDQCNIDQTMRENCAICDSTTDPNCASTPSSFVQMCPFVYEYDAGGCYLHKRVDGGIQRGCMVTATTDFIDICRKGEECKICRGQICNTKVDFQECHVCDSEVDEDLTCLSNPANSPTKICQDYGDSCAQLVVANGKTVRGCLQDLDGSTSTFCPSNNCQICSNNNCNSNIFPSDRITCHQCNDEENCYKDMTSIGNVAYPCRNYALDDQCYTVQEESVVYRGCLSDRTPEKSTCDIAGDLCNKCSEQGCNSGVIEPPTEPPTTQPTDQTTQPTDTTAAPPPERRWCVQCSGAINSDCSYYQASDKSTQCTGSLEPGQIEQCYFIVEGNTVRRGCTGDRYCDSRDCTQCNYNHCNFHSKATMECKQCNSRQGSDEDRERCRDKPEELSTTPCALNDVFSIEDAGCYSMRLNITVDGETESYVRRGCKYMMLLDPRCDDDEDDSCIMCQGDGCNTHDVSYSAKLYPTMGILLASLLLIIMKNFSGSV
ncbi:uncharacterized protein LOC129787909 isoform X1 [Lutzomyia longipalpis]|uniref:uncharacterized protein LOC129787909 isoform X1 n=1 Tax=Lutzomyia longipalpis TaxID=7200 RepID=UPI002483DAC6|nr:uncharacterized protein LOC129787909 isoform X1 [Lutzomyia longipalpis]